MRKTKRVCETASKKVRQALIDTDGKLSCYYTFIGKLPAISEHNHPVGEVSLFYFLFYNVLTLVKSKLNIKITVFNVSVCVYSTTKNENEA